MELRNPDLKSFAKVNLILDLGKKNESGRFETDFLMQEIDLFDSIEMEASDGIIIECSDPSVPTDETNLCYKAAEWMGKLSGKSRGVKISIQKNIPAAGGLGGGSSNAALVVRELNQRWGLGMTEEDMIREINPLLGTDASFFIKGGTARVRKNGKEVVPVSTSEKLAYVFVLPKVKVPEAKTENVYKYFQPDAVTEKVDREGMIGALRKGSSDEVAKHLFNAFEFSLPPYYSPAIPNLKNELVEAGCLGALMCGAGPTVFGICRDRKEAESIGETLKGRYALIFTAESAR